MEDSRSTETLPEEVVEVLPQSGFKGWIQQRCAGDFLSLASLARGQEDGPADPFRSLPAYVSVIPFTSPGSAGI